MGFKETAVEVLMETNWKRYVFTLVFALVLLKVFDIHSDYSLNGGLAVAVAMSVASAVHWSLTPDLPKRKEAHGR